MGIFDTIILDWNYFLRRSFHPVCVKSESMAKLAERGLVILAKFSYMCRVIFNNLSYSSL